MAKIEDNSFFMNPAVYSQVKPEDKKTGSSRGIRGDFSRFMDDLRGKTADELGPLRDLPVSEETVNLLMDDVRSAGDNLQSRPFPDEILRYKQAVRNFINYIVQNNYSKETEAGIPNMMKPSFTGRRDDRNKYVKIQVIDKKLEDLAAMLLSSQSRQLNLVSRLEEIRGLLVDLMQ